MNDYTPMSNNENPVETPAYAQPVNTAPVYAQPLTPVLPAEKKIWQIFAKISFILGFVGLAGAFIPYLQLITADFCIVGIVFAILGKKAPSMASKCKTALICNIIGAVLGIVMFIIYYVVLIGALTATAYMY